MLSTLLTVTVSANLIRVRKFLPSILVCIAVLLLGALPLARALNQKTDRIEYTSDVFASGAFIPYESLKPGAQLCVPDAEVATSARSARVFVRSTSAAVATIRLTVRRGDGSLAAVASARQRAQAPGEEHAVEIPLRVASSVGFARVCASNAGRRAVDVGVGQAGSVGFAQAPRRPLLRVDLLAGPPEARIDRVGHALLVATYFKASIVGRGLLIGLGLAFVLGVIALVVAVLRRADVDDAGSR